MGSEMCIRDRATLFAHTGSVRALDIEASGNEEFDLIINATSSGIDGDVPAIPVSLINPHVCCYDMFYQKGSTPFLSLCQQHGATKCADGLGMLVAQAAHAVLLWHGILPDITPVIAALQKELNA